MAAASGAAGALYPGEGIRIQLYCASKRNEAARAFRGKPDAALVPGGGDRARKPRGDARGHGRTGIELEIICIPYVMRLPWGLPSSNLPGKYIAFSFKNVGFMRLADVSNNSSLVLPKGFKLFL